MVTSTWSIPNQQYKGQYMLYLQDLSNYKYDSMINKSLGLLNKYYSSKTKLFKMAVQAMVILIPTNYNSIDMYEFIHYILFTL